MFNVDQTVEGEYYLAAKGKFKGHDRDTIVVNVYGPHDDNKKRVFFDSLENLMKFDNENMILCGDFNEVRRMEERRNCEFNQRRATRFNKFIDKAGLVDVPLVGKKYTRICDNGKKFSKLDRVLVSGSVLNIWSELSVLVLDMLRSKVIDYGPKPVKVFDSWLKHPDAGNVISEAWDTQVKATRPDIIFRLKLKNLKTALKN
ncbi:uncharacterized protein [Rutidosis leptorrhynchoides]|uniref:uncharacterized protein n=1 Tax=Rutidosis leptorrhynchoides TaxID=125765 RepID=UPI003A9A13F6